MPNRLTATQAAGAMREGRLTVETMVTACLERIRLRQDAVQGWAFIDPDRVLSEARALDRSDARKGPLHGVPIAVKDVILTADLPTQQGSPLYEGCMPGIDAACVATLRSAGALIIGKTDTTEFAATTRGNRARHPLDPTRTPGGSSSGSAAVVADFQAPIGLGTQTAGSVIRPASFCGVVAMKPTWSAISREGLKMLSPTLDTLGFFTRGIDDLALLADVFGLADRVPPSPFTLADARIAACHSPAWSKAAPETRDAFTRGVSLLQAAGATVVPLELPATFDALPEHHGIVMFGEAQASFLNEDRRANDAISADIEAMATNARGITRGRLIEAYDAAAACRAEFDALASPFDAILTPSAPGEAPVGTTTGDASFNAIWSLLHVPVINVPGFGDPTSLPVGLSLVAPRYRDRHLINVAQAIARALPAENRAA